MFEGLSLPVLLLWKNVYLGLPSILWLDCLFVWIYWASCLYILEINAFSVASFANIFSHSEDCLFVLTIFFAVHTLLSLVRSNLFIFVFIFITLGGGSKKIWKPGKRLPRNWHWNFFLYSGRSLSRTRGNKDVLEIKQCSLSFKSSLLQWEAFSTHSNSGWWIEILGES